MSWEFRKGLATYLNNKMVQWLKIIKTFGKYVNVHTVKQNPSSGRYFLQRALQDFIPLHQLVMPWHLVETTYQIRLVLSVLPTRRCFRLQPCIVFLGIPLNGQQMQLLCEDKPHCLWVAALSLMLPSSKGRLSKRS